MGMFTKRDNYENNSFVELPLDGTSVKYLQVP
jgi:hypothetical protein